MATWESGTVRPSKEGRDSNKADSSREGMIDKECRGCRGMVLINGRWNDCARPLCRALRLLSMFYTRNLNIFLKLARVNMFN